MRKNTKSKVFAKTHSNQNTDVTLEQALQFDVNSLTPEYCNGDRSLEATFKNYIAQMVSYVESGDIKSDIEALSNCRQLMANLKEIITKNSGIR